MLVATIANQRSGTKYFGSFFLSGQEVSPFGELFNPDDDGPFSFRAYLKSRNFDEIFASGSEQILDKYFSYFSARRGAIQFDLMFNQIEFCCTSWNSFAGPFMYNYLKSRAAAVILLKRDPTEVFFSLRLLEKTGIPHTLTNESISSSEIAVPEITVRRSEFNLFRDWLSGQYLAVENAFSNYGYFLSVSYEDVVTTSRMPDGVLDMIVANAADNNHMIEKERIAPGAALFRRGPKLDERGVTWIEDTLELG